MHHPEAVGTGCPRPALQQRWSLFSHTNGNGDLGVVVEPPVQDGGTVVGGAEFLASRGAGSRIRTRAPSLLGQQRRAAQAVRRVWKLARLRYRKQLQPEFWIGRNKLGIPLACPQNLRSNGVSRGGSRGPPQVRWPGRCRPSPRKWGNRAPGQISILPRRGAPRANERKAMITFLVLIIIPTLIILNRLENSRSRRKVSVDGFKVINGHIVRRKS